MDIRELKKLIALMNNNGLTRLELEEEGKRWLLEKAMAPAPVQVPAPMPPPFAVPAPAPAPAAPPAAESSKPEGTVTFNAPMVGTFFRAPTPESEAFVKVGDKVEPSTVLCLIEAMKVFNEIKAEMSGTVVEVLAENQEAVEYNQPLYLIKPS